MLGLVMMTAACGNAAGYAPGDIRAESRDPSSDASVAGSEAVGITVNAAGTADPFDGGTDAESDGASAQKRIISRYMVLGNIRMFVEFYDTQLGVTCKFMQMPQPGTYACVHYASVREAEDAFAHPERYDLGYIVEE